MSNSSSTLTREEAAAYLNISPKTLANWASNGKVQIPYSKLGKLVRYQIADLDIYLESNKMLHTGLKAN